MQPFVQPILVNKRQTVIQRKMSPIKLENTIFTLHFSDSYSAWHSYCQLSDLNLCQHSLKPICTVDAFKLCNPTQCCIKELQDAAALQWEGWKEGLNSQPELVGTGLSTDKDTIPILL